MLMGTTLSRPCRGGVLFEQSPEAARLANARRLPLATFLWPLQGQNPSRLQKTEQLTISGLEVLGEDARFANRRHEICISDPARQKVHVKVIGDSRSTGTPEVHSQVEP